MKVNMMTQLFFSFARGFFGLVLGTYIFSALIWIFSKKEKEIIPILIAASAFLGAVAAFLILVFFVAIFYPQLEGNENFIINLVFLTVQYLFPVAVIYWAVFRAFRQERITPRNFIRRIILFVAGSALVMFPMILMYPRSSFPAAESLEKRDEWARKEFAKHYEFAKKYVGRSQRIKEDIGDIRSVAPAVNSVNKVTVAPGDPGVGSFTLEVAGEKGTGLCSMVVSFRDTRDGERVDYTNARWEFNGKVENLPFSSRRIDIQ